MDRARMQLTARHAVALWLLVPVFAVRRLRQWWAER